MLKITAYTTFALVAFAFNSILCRLALRGNEAEAFGFTSTRLIAGAVMLTVLCGVTGKPIKLNLKKNYYSALYLFLYAFLFSLAYYDLSAGVGALILFGSVQLTMITVGVVRGEHPSKVEWIGLVVAVAGLIYLLFPGLTAPSIMGSLMMAGAGAAWGAYTLHGKGSTDPLSDTNANFVIAALVMLAMFALEGGWQDIEMTRFGVLLAVISGAVTSGIGYAVWYAALKHHTPTRAAVLQLSVPVITAFIGVSLLSEAMTMRLLIAAALILGGIGLTIAGRRDKA